MIFIILFDFGSTLESQGAPTGRLALQIIAALGLNNNITLLYLSDSVNVGGEPFIFQAVSR